MHNNYLGGVQDCAGVPTFGLRYDSKREGKGCTSPGPGRYNTAKTLGCGGPICSIKGKWRRRVSSEESVPGPGRYMVDSSKERQRIRGGAFSLDGNILSLTSMLGSLVIAPGPGHYSTCSDLGGPRYKFGTDIKLKTKQTSSDPGPGQYHRILQQNGPAVSMSPRWTDTVKVDPSPGPAAYHTNVHTANQQ